MNNNNNIPEIIEAIFIESIEDLLKFIEEEDKLQELIEQQQKTEKY